MTVRVANILCVFDDASPFGPSVPKNAGRQLEISRGEFVDLKMRIVRNSGAPLNLHGAIVVVTVKTRASDTVPLLARLAVVDNEDGGTCTASIISVDTGDLQPGRYVWDVWVTIDGAQVQVLPTSTFVVRAATGPGEPLTLPSSVTVPVIGIPKPDGSEGNVLTEHADKTMTWESPSGGGFDGDLPSGQLTLGSDTPSIKGDNVGAPLAISGGPRAFGQSGGDVDIVPESGGNANLIAGPSGPGGVIPGAVSVDVIDRDPALQSGQIGIGSSGNASKVLIGNQATPTEVQGDLAVDGNLTSGGAPVGAPKYYLARMPGFNVSDIGPALAEAFAAIHADTGKGNIIIPDGQNVLVTPVSYDLDNGERILIEGESEGAAIVFNCGDTNNGITIGHAVSSTGLFFGMRNLTLRGFVDQTFSMAYGVKIDMNVFGEQLLERITCYGCYARQSILRCEDGTAVVRNINFYGSACDNSNGHGLLQMFQTYRGEVSNIYQAHTGSYNGQLWSGGLSAAVVEWQAPQLNFGGAPSPTPNGYFNLRDVLADLDMVNAVLLNNLAAYRGVRARVKDITAKCQGGSSIPVLMREISDVEVDGIYTNAAISGYLVGIYSCGNVRLRALHGENSADGGSPTNANLVIVNNALGNTQRVTLEDCVLGSSSTPGVNGNPVAGVDADPSVTDVVFVEGSAKARLFKTASNDLIKVGADLGITGQGTDGALHVTNGQVFEMDRDYHWSSVTVDSGGTLRTNRWQIFCTGQVLNNGLIDNSAANGHDATDVSGAQGGGSLTTAPFVAAALGTAGELAPGGAGGNGDTPSGGFGGDLGGSAKLFAAAGGNPSPSAHSGNGGDGTGTGGGSGVNASDHPATVLPVSIINPIANAQSGIYGVPIAAVGGQGGPGGGGGGSDGVSGNGGGGGGGGGAGGIIRIFAGTCVNNGTIRAKGGNGGNGAQGNTDCGGGGAGFAGSGGYVEVWASGGVTGSGSIDVSAGTHGSPGAANGGGAAGAACVGVAATGHTRIIDLLTQAISYT